MSQYEQKDHSLPQVLLRGFSVNGRGKEVVLYRKSQPLPTAVKIKDSFRNHDHFSDPDRALDAVHQRYENEIGPVLKELRKGAKLNGSFTESLVRFASHLLLRSPGIHSRLEAMLNAAIDAFAHGSSGDRAQVLKTASREAVAAVAHQRLYDPDDRVAEETAGWARQLDTPRIVAAPEGRFWVTGDVPALMAQGGPRPSQFFWFPFSSKFGLLAGNPPVVDERALADQLNFSIVALCFDSVIGDCVDTEMAELVRFASAYRVGYAATGGAIEPEGAGLG